MLGLKLTCYFLSMVFGWVLIDLLKISTYLDSQRGINGVSSFNGQISHGALQVTYCISMSLETHRVQSGRQGARVLAAPPALNMGFIVAAHILRYAIVHPLLTIIHLMA